MTNDEGQLIAGHVARPGRTDDDIHGRPRHSGRSSSSAWKHGVSPPRASP